MMNKKIIVVCVIFILLSTIAVAFFDTIQQAMIFLQAGSNIKLTPNPIITLGKISLTDDISIHNLEATGSISVDGNINVTGNVNVTGCIVHSCGTGTCVTLGTCI